MEISIAHSPEEKKPEIRIQKPQASIDLPKYPAGLKAGDTVTVTVTGTVSYAASGDSWKCEYETNGFEGTMKLDVSSAKVTQTNDFAQLLEEDD